MKEGDAQTVNAIAEVDNKERSKKEGGKVWVIEHTGDPPETAPRRSKRVSMNMEHRYTFLHYLIFVMAANRYQSRYYGFTDDYRTLNDASTFRATPSYCPGSFSGGCR